MATIRPKKIEAVVQLVVTPGKDSEPALRKQFEQLVLQEPQVDKATLTRLVAKAHFLAFLFFNDQLVGTGAVKNNRSYWQTLEAKSGVSLPEHDYFGEVGYIHVEKDHRGKRLGDLLLLGSLAMIEKGVFATIQAKNIPSRRLFERHGFMQVGKSWPSSQNDDQVSLYLRQGR